MALEKTWRWFGPNDKITLPMLRQIGVEGIVTALHHIPNGEIWPMEEIEKIKSLIASHGMRWSVVESLPVSESIKYGGPDRDELIEKYKVSLANLGKAGVKTVCYNFMPVLDWARTDLESPNPDGTIFISTVPNSPTSTYIFFGAPVPKPTGTAARLNGWSALPPQ